MILHSHRFYVIELGHSFLSDWVKLKVEMKNVFEETRCITSCQQTFYPFFENAIKIRRCFSFCEVADRKGCYCEASTKHLPKSKDWNWKSNDFQLMNWNVLVLNYLITRSFNSEIGGMVRNRKH